MKTHTYKRLLLIVATSALAFSGIHAFTLTAQTIVTPIIPQACPGSIGSPCYGGNGFVEPNVEGVAENIDIKQFILRIIAFVLDFVLILAVLMIIIAGVYLIASNGDEGNKEKAKKIVIYTIAGILLILFARAIVVYINNFLG